MELFFASTSPAEWTKRKKSPFSGLSFQEMRVGRAVQDVFGMGDIPLSVSWTQGMENGFRGPSEKKSTTADFPFMCP
jgi:hypothetical protein